MNAEITIEVEGHVIEVPTDTLTGNQIKRLSGRHEGSDYRLDGEVRHTRTCYRWWTI